MRHLILVGNREWFGCFHTFGASVYAFDFASDFVINSTIIYLVSETSFRDRKCFFLSWLSEYRCVINSRLRESLGEYGRNIHFSITFQYLFPDTDVHRF